ncbi:MAG: hypothetical protein SVM80_11510 [Halobacteriota archaeon]|nr:hypothetical protein [Halobacteriota archaeon]
MIILTSGCIDFLSPDIYDVDVPYSKPSGARICLVNYKNATDPTWDELVSFLEVDDTDENLYINDSFVCGDFAEMLHNNAEKSGIKASWVAISFADRDPHALNAFNTTDRGLVYVDCTRADIDDDRDGEGCSQDKIGYLVLGKEYATISIDKAASMDYDFYEVYKMSWENLKKDYQAYNKDVDEHNEAVELYNRSLLNHQEAIEIFERELRGRTIISDLDEYKRLSKMQLELIAQGEEILAQQEEINSQKDKLDEILSEISERQDELGCHFKPLGIVEDIEIYW